MLQKSNMVRLQRQQLPVPTTRYVEQYNLQPKPLLLLPQNDIHLNMRLMVLMRLLPLLPALMKENVVQLILKQRLLLFYNDDSVLLC